MEISFRCMMPRQLFNLVCLTIMIGVTLTSARSSACAQDLAPPSFSNVEEANAYVRSIAPKEATCSENKYKIAGCYVARGDANLWIDEKYDTQALVVGVQIAVTNTSFPGEDGSRQAAAALDTFVETSIKPFLSTLQLDNEKIKKCTSKSTNAAKITEELHRQCASPA